MSDTDDTKERIKLLLERLDIVAEKYDYEITTSELLRAENARLKEFLKLIYENRLEIDKLYIYAERAKEYFTEEK